MSNAGTGNGNGNSSTQSGHTVSSSSSSSTRKTASKTASPSKTSSSRLISTARSQATTTSSSPNASKTNKPAPASLSHPLSAGAIAGVVIGSLAVLVAAIGIFMLVYRRRRRHRLRRTSGYIAPLEQEFGGPSNTDPVTSGRLVPVREKRLDVDHTQLANHAPIPQASTFESEPEISQSNIPLGRIVLQPPPSSNRLSLTLPSPTPPSSAPQSSTSILVPEESPEDMRAQVASLTHSNIRMEVAIGKMVEHIHRLESQVERIGDADSDAPPPISFQSRIESHYHSSQLPSFVSLPDILEPSLRSAYQTELHYPNINSFLTQTRIR
ncbi:hypothetical protein BDP27DRAFT_1426149 [Rhodocollybia butyracea]|uniref:Uncharacterized protein n=1 Tax=Rhodocollybia butyracea TaxID=206335 RepID=A0A9P5U1Y1_9AGAR|nr:hypothetical protein BDP27DRAFT_1426149 [Rhodocollybia butyracea]